MATPGATTKGNLGPGPVHADGGAPRRRRAPRRVLARPRHTRALAAAFPHLPQSLLGEMAQGLEEARFRPGDVIVREGDPADRFYIIESGQVEATKSAAEGDVHVRTMGAGEYFGEVGLLATRTRTATVRAVSEVRVLSLDRARFQALVDASAPTADDLAQVVTDRNVPAQPRADRIPLPAWTGRLRRLAKAPWAMHYNRLIVLVLAANALLAAYVAGHGEHLRAGAGDGRGDCPGEHRAGDHLPSAVRDQLPRLARDAAARDVAGQGALDAGQVLPFRRAARRVRAGRDGLVPRVRGDADLRLRRRQGRRRRRERGSLVGRGEPDRGDRGHGPPEFPGQAARHVSRRRTGSWAGRCWCSCG